MIYFQDKDYSESFSTKIDNKRPDYRLQTNDVIAVKVKSSTDPEISDIFNITTTQGTMLFMNPGNLYLEGYSIDEEGKITLPILGSVTVKDRTLEEARDVIQLSADKYLNNATVMVRLVSFKITVLGEVKNPGYHYVFNNQVTVLEALGLAGDLTSQGNRKNVKLLRPTKTGNEVVLLDLTDPDLLKSQYFYLMPNDVLYVEPFKARSDRSNLELLGVVFSAATTAILILNYVENN
jgi:polysaccharide export outer membrane protein